jgi:hypothetical protein
MLNFILTIIIFTISINFLHGQENNTENYISRSDIEQILNSTYGSFHSEIEESLIKIDSIELLLKVNQRIGIENSEKQNLKFIELERQIINPPKSFWGGFFYPILISLIAALFFWFVFYLIERSKKRKIRVKLDLELYHIYSNISSIFGIIFLKNHNLLSYYHRHKKWEELSNRDFEIALQNKCLNETYLLYPELNTVLFPIGERLYNYVHKIEVLIDRLYGFSLYMSTKEILILDDIRNKLNTYDLKENSTSYVGKLQFKPINPSLYYMANTLFELYNTNKRLRNIVYQNKLENRNIFLTKTKYHLEKAKYGTVIKSVKKGLKTYPNDKDLLKWYLFQSLYKLKKYRKAYSLLDDILKEKMPLYSYRNSLNNFFNDTNVTNILVKYYSDKEITEYEKAIEKENLTAKEFIEKAKYLEEFYKRKSSESNK